MQNTLPLTPGNPLKNMTGLARQISLPGEHAPIRFPSFPALERTAVIGFNQPASIPVAPQTPLAITQFRQAAYPCWADISRRYFSIVDGTVAQLFPGVQIVPGDSNTVPVASRYMSWSTTNVVASQIRTGVTGAISDFPDPLLGRDDLAPGPEFVYLPSNSTLGIVFNLEAPLPAGATMYVSANLVYWNQPGQVADDLQASFSVLPGYSSGMFFTTTLKSGWYRIKNFSLTLNGTGAYTSQVFNHYSLFVVSGKPTISFTPTTTSLCGTVTIGAYDPTIIHMPLVLPNEFSNSSMPWRATRVTASAVLGTNVTPVLNKGGTILGGRVSPCVRNAWDVDSGYIAGLHPAEKAYLPMETGVYTFCPPSTDLVFFHDYTVNLSGWTAVPNSELPVFQLTNDSMYNKLFVTVPIAGELACTVSWHLEFRTSSALFQVGLSAMTLESLHSAQLVLADLGFFFENPEHEKLITKVINGAKRFAPTIAGIYSPSLGRLVSSAMGTVKPRKGPSKPATTTAANSGITSKPKKAAAAKGQGKGKKKSKK